MAKVSRKFATNEAVIKLANDIRKVNDNIDIKASEAATAAAGMVLRQIGPDVEALNQKIDNKSFNVEIVESTPEGLPAVLAPNNHTIYLTLNETEEPHNYWTEWLAVTSPASLTVRWERIGAKQIDISWIQGNFDRINEEICKLNCKLRKFSKDVAKAIVDKAVKPIEELRAYLSSEEFVTWLTRNIPAASWTNDGLMSANMFALLMNLSIWVNNDYKVMGGGALGADFIEEAFNNH